MKLNNLKSSTFLYLYVSFIVQILCLLKYYNNNFRIRILSFSKKKNEPKNFPENSLKSTF